MCNLLEALDYENEEVVIEAFRARYDVTKEEAYDIFLETKKWLWLATQNTDFDKSTLFIDDSLAIIDEMWHNFILHTKYYYDYCISKFKKIIHHYPTSVEEKKKLEYEYKMNPSKVLSEHEKMVKKQYSIIYDHLGEKTLIKWYGVFAQKYTPEYIRSIKKT